MNKSIGPVILQISVALYLFATGILGMSGRNWFREGEIRRAVSAVFKDDFAEVVIIIISVCAIAAGALLLLELVKVHFAITELLLIILMIVWVIFIFMIDIYYPLNNRPRNFNFVEYLRGLGAHLMVLGGMACAVKKFGGR